MRETYEELLEAGYSPADASMLTRTRNFQGPKTPQRPRSPSGPSEPREPPEETRMRLGRATRDTKKERALDAVQWAQHWTTWPPGGNSHAGYLAALSALTANPDLSKFDLARVAIEAAKPKGES